MCFSRAPVADALQACRDARSALQAPYRARELRRRWQKKTPQAGDLFMSLSILLLIVLLLLMIGALPSWPYSTAWGYAPSGILGAVLLAVLVLFLMGRL
jgi:Flp pilus assembly protein TadB